MATTAEDDRRVLTVPEAARLLRVSERTYYDGFRRGELPGVRVGRVIRVPGVLLSRYLAGEHDVARGEVGGETTSATDDETPVRGLRPGA